MFIFMFSHTHLIATSNSHFPNTHKNSILFLYQVKEVIIWQASQSAVTRGNMPLAAQ